MTRTPGPGGPRRAGLEMDVSDGELARRRASWVPPDGDSLSGGPGTYSRPVLGADAAAVTV
jgi:hypothetical protein